MYLQEFPDLKWLKNTINNRFEARKDWQGNPLKHAGWPSVVLNVKTNQTYRDNIVGPVSLFGNLSGASWVTVENRKLFVPAGYFFISNEGQEYTLEVDNQKTETFNIHFGSHFTAQAFQSLRSSEFEPGNGNKTPEFRNRLIPFDDVTKNLIQKIKSNQSDIAEQEYLYELLNHLIKREKDIIKLSETLPVLKKATRDEVFKRLLTSVDYVYSSSSQKLSLDELARTACLSKFHFLRLFKSTFNKTPYQFINEVRIGRAKEFLLSKELSVREIAHQTGFESSSTFSRTFYQIQGVYPTQFVGKG
jgi:AraC family transcriptional regulator